MKRGEIRKQTRQLMIRIHKFIEERQNSHQPTPSRAEIAERFGISSTSVVNYYLDRMVRDGLLEPILYNTARCLYTKPIPQDYLHA